MEFRNLTPHPVRILGSGLDPDDPLLEIDPDPEGPARVLMDLEHLHELDDIPVVREEPGETSGLPEPTMGVGFIVSRLVAEAHPLRPDLFYPARLVRNQEGEIVGCEALGMV